MRVLPLTLAALLVVLVGVPVALAPREGERADRATEDAGRVIIFTPHNEQIRQEFDLGFQRWHKARYGGHVTIGWMQPGGTSEIRKMLESAYAADLKEATGGGFIETGVGGNGDLLFGGGSYEFMQLSKELSVTVDGETRATTVLAPIEFGRPYLDAVYGPGADGAPPRIGDIPLYDAKGMWYGAALSGFGIVWNPQLLRELAVPEPTRWSDLCNPRLFGYVVLVNPAQSGSVTTAFEAILQRRGWTEGWRILRRMAANARSFAASAPKAPTDVSLGDAAAGVCIDFYGRFQAQAMLEAAAADGRDGETERRVGYVDPAGETVIDPDPIAMLRGAPHPELARRFVEFVLSDEGQSLWNFRSRGRLTGRYVDTPDDGLGPEMFELRRMPVRRDLYERHGERFVDDVDPWAIATAVENPNPNYRAFLPSMFVAMAIDNRELLRDAWEAIFTHPEYARRSEDGTRIVTVADVDDLRLKQMLELFDTMPSVRTPQGAVLSLADELNLATVRAGWLKREWSDAHLWPEDALPAEYLRARMAESFRLRYERILILAAEGRGKGRR